MITNLFGLIKESFYFSIAISLLLLVYFVDGVAKFVRSPLSHPHGYR